MAPVYEKISPYASCGALANLDPPVESSAPRLIWPEKATSSVENITSSPMLMVLSAATWLRSVFFWSKTFWPPVLSELTISFVLYRGWRQLEVLATLMPSQERIAEAGWAGKMVILRMALSWFLYSVGTHWAGQKYTRQKDPESPRRPTSLVPPTESSPATSPDPTASGRSIDSLVILCPENGLADGTAPSVDVSVRTGSPRERDNSRIRQCCPGRGFYHTIRRGNLRTVWRWRVPVD